MSLLLLLIIFLLPVLNGGMLVHLIWPEREVKAFVFKAFLGIGIGLGVWSLVYFLYMLFFAGQRWFIFIQLGISLGLFVLTVQQERRRGPFQKLQWQLTRVQAIMVGLAAVVFLVSLLSTASYLMRRKQGDWDAWMMFNRAALFVSRDPVHWLESSMPITHCCWP